MVPAGTTNIAAGKHVSGSDEDPIGGPLSKITDGDKAGIYGSFIELGMFEQNVTIDLGAQSEIYAIVVWHSIRHAVYYDVIVETADDKDFTKNVDILFNNDHDETSGFGKGKDKNKGKGIKVRMFLG